MADPALQVPTGLTTQGSTSRRYTAFFIDWLLLATCAAILVWIERIAAPDLALKGYSEGFELALYLVLWIGYGTVLESSVWQATLGKRWMDLRVYDTNGGRLSLRQAATRNVIKDAPILLLQFVPDGLVISWLILGAHVILLHRSRINRAIHDRIAGSWVAAQDKDPQVEIE
jgi:uncharacterized RDD family membrane protein YckC